LGGEVLDFANDGFAIQDFAEDDVLAVEVGGWDCGDEKLGTIGTYSLKSAQVITIKVILRLYQDPH
jgi:hypothetical protein